MKTRIGIVLLMIACTVQAQQKDGGGSVSMGVEVDALPYLTGGYYGSIWAGHDHIRYRAIVTKITTPSFMLDDGFTNNKIQSYTAIADYFFRQGFEKWWVGAGIEYWRGQIQSGQKLGTARYENFILTGGGGYVWRFYRNFYLNPWVAVHLRAAGNDQVDVDGQQFRPARLTPEASLKIGWKIALPRHEQR